MLYILILISVLTAIACSSLAGAQWDVRSDTWVGTDALGRKLPTHKECGSPRKDKCVAIFYFTWHGQHASDGPFDLTKILAANPDNPQLGPAGSFHHWGEPEVGYYNSGDEWVIRRHCRMLTDAGVDVLVFDVTNAWTYTNVYMRMCEVFTKIRAEGGSTPQLCFIANSSSDETVMRLYDEFYSKKLYPDLWFRWLGKPLVLAQPGDKISQEVKDFFTWRQSWAWHDPNGWFGNGKDKWPWLDHHPQAVGWHEEGVAEQTSVTVAQHPTTNIGRSFHNGKEPAPADWRTAEGLCFAEQIRRALEVDPRFVYVTGWNEWVAMRFLSEGVHDMMCGRKLNKGDSIFVDAYTQEFSRDIEPMKAGHNDNYYYQLIDFIRRYKGVRAPEPPGKPKNIKIDGDFSAWNAVTPEYRDHIGDTLHRDSTGWGSVGKYTDKTGRNDFVRLKVAYDAKNVYFYAETNEPITKHTDPAWMLLFIDSDQNASTGWMGYDFVVNYQPASATKSSLCRNRGGWNWEHVCDIPIRVKGKQMELAVPRASIGKPGKGAPLFDFHWMDNLQLVDGKPDWAGTWDSAPDRRFNYRYGVMAER